MIVKALQLTEQGGIVILRHGRLPGEPGEDLLIGELQKLFEKAKLTLVEALKARIREASHQQVHLANAAVPRAKTQAPPANLRFGMHESRAFGVQVSGLPRRATHPYIAKLAQRVMGRECDMLPRTTLALIFPG